MGAIGEDGVRVLNDGLLYRLGVRAAFVAEVERRERAELKRRASCYRGDRPAVPLEGKVALVVDDGIATGATARAACAVVAQRGADRVVLATPVMSADAARILRVEVDDLIAVMTLEDFGSVGSFYRDFRETSDDEVIAMLRGR
jgi:putative phosphoribosyl transferase